MVPSRHPILTDSSRGQGLKILLEIFKLALENYDEKEVSIFLAEY
jgi:hypothetical protein